MITLTRNRIKEREIFRYHDGERDRAADPIVVFRKMAEHPEFKLEQHIAELQIEDPKIQNEASRIAVAATREIFGLNPWTEDNETGLTEMETLEVLSQFIVYVEQLKKNGVGPPT